MHREMISYTDAVVDFNASFINSHLKANIYYLRKRGRDIITCASQKMETVKSMQNLFLSFNGLVFA